MPDAFDTPLDQLPPITRALRESWPAKTTPLGNTAATEPVPTSHSMRALLTAVHQLEIRLAAIEGSG
ncbi:hypothetical protein [Mycobacterium camsae]|uniref:hypothetical protein n=1 Tax=Mycobacterium gordonae TaxID=1778 RepID=UPI001980992F|nr:hypothetical protein [Mycobacterium gordonae]